VIKNSQPFGKKFQKTVGGIFFDSRCIYHSSVQCAWLVGWLVVLGTHTVSNLGCIFIFDGPKDVPFECLNNII